MEIQSQRIYNEILSGEYECIICLNSITRQSPIWSCKFCFRSFDVKCIQEWGLKTLGSKKEWSCPHCLASQSQDVRNLHYRCWCGKQKDPRSKKHSGASKSLLAPHSCGQTCGFKRSCSHPCPLTCHAGPHADSADCLYMGPKIYCYCGKRNEQVICSQTRYNQFSCGGECGKLISICGHKCEKTCHRGSKSNQCEPCSRKIKLTCYCGAIENTKRKCCDLTKKQRASLKSGINLKISCGKVCGKILSCGKHRCETPCHSSDNPHFCKLTPFKGETCFCGKTASRRVDCLDPKLSCGKPCEKKLSCGHLCLNMCHDGNCPPCKQVITGVKCRCKATYQEKVCSDANSPTCNKKCDVLLSCKRHRCLKICCEFNKQSPKQPINSREKRIGLEELLSGTNLHNNQSTDNLTEAEETAHLCLKICGRVLSCGIHICERLCHVGKCNPCTSTSFEEWSCSCGETIVEPPIRCGTVMPQCRKTCKRSQPCGHKATHFCHSDNVSCSPCTQLVSVPCKCGKSLVKEKCCDRDKNSNLSCGTICGKKLDCGHTCLNLCCSKSEICPPCGAQCSKIYNCGHSHEAKCHFLEACPHECTKKLVAKCPCGITKFTYECGENVEIGCTNNCQLEAYAQILLEAYENEPKWFLQVQSKIRAFIIQRESKILWFKPMNRRHRRYLHYMLEHYGLQGESVDSGENRSVCGKFTDKTRLCKTLIQFASKVEPQYYADPIIEEEHADSVLLEESDEERKIDADGFVKVTNKTKEIESPKRHQHLVHKLATSNPFLILE